jgi:hypothetical protein
MAAYTCTAFAEFGSKTVFSRDRVTPVRRDRQLFSTAAALGNPAGASEY